LQSLRIRKREISIICMAAVLLVGWLLFGITGVRLIIGMLLLFVLPFYLILGYFELDTMERLFLGFFLGFGLVPIIIFYMNKIISSLKVSTLVTFLVLLAVGLFLKYGLAKTSSA